MFVCRLMLRVNSAIDANLDILLLEVITVKDVQLVIALELRHYANLLF